MLIQFTSYDQIRAVLGVSELELEDDTLALPLYHHTLLWDLELISEPLSETYLAALNLAPGGRTAAQQKLVDLVQVYSSYQVSKTLLTSLPYFAPKQITDGRAGTERFADVFEVTRNGVAGSLNQVKARLRSLASSMGMPVTLPSTRQYTLGVPPATDPVVGS